MENKIMKTTELINCMEIIKYHIMKGDMIKVKELLNALINNIK